MYYKLVSTFLAITLIGYLYDKYNIKQERAQSKDHYDIVRKHLLGDKLIHLEKYKPTIWIHIDYERNSRQWASFYSRSSNDINVPYIYSLLSNLIKYCSFDFNVCIVSDDSFSKLIPNWNHNLSNISGTTLYLMRHFAMCKLLSIYGGIVLNTDCLVVNELKTLYDSMTKTHTMFVGELPTTNKLNHKLHTFPSHKIIGCNKGCSVIKSYCDYIERIIKRDYTLEYAFSGELDKKLHELIQHNKCGLIPAGVLGVVDNQNNVLSLDNLMDNQYIEFNPNMKILYVNLEQIKSRVKYGWFLRQNKEQLYENKNVISDFII